MSAPNEKGRVAKVDKLAGTNHAIWRSRVKKALQTKKLWRITSGAYTFNDLCDDGSATDQLKNETSSSSSTSDAATPTPYTAKYLALKRGEWEHKQLLLASGLVLFAVSAAPGCTPGMRHTKIP